VPNRSAPRLLRCAALIALATACGPAAEPNASELGDKPQADVSTCAERAQGITARFAALDLGCTSNEDCGIAHAPPSCPISACGSVVSHAHQSEIEAIDDELCVDFAADGCLQDVAQSDCVKRGPVACIDDRCVDCAVESCERAGCARCHMPNISWSPLNVADGWITYSISDCSTLSLSESANNLAGETVFHGNCSGSLPCVGTVAKLQNIFGDPEFQAAMARGTTVDVPGLGIEVTVGSGAGWLISDCARVRRGVCTPAPPSVLAFVRILQGIEQPACNP
jgi:hypothetical protein